MRNIVLCRIDDRLIHGQVVTAWVKQTDGNRIVIVDDALTKDAFMQKILAAAAPPGIKVEVLSIEAAAEDFKSDASAEEKIIILVKVPEVVEALVKKGVQLDKVILGGMQAKAGRKKFNKNVSASPEEVDTMRRLVDGGVVMHFQLVPNEQPTDVRKMLS